MNRFFQGTLLAALALTAQASNADVKHQEPQFRLDQNYHPVRVYDQSQDSQQLPRPDDQQQPRPDDQQLRHQAPGSRPAAAPAHAAEAPIYTHKLIGTGNVRYEYDDRGNMILEYEPGQYAYEHRYEYDEQNRIISEDYTSMSYDGQENYPTFRYIYRYQYIGDVTYRTYDAQYSYAESVGLYLLRSQNRDYNDHGQILSYTEEYFDTQGQSTSRDVNQYEYNGDDDQTLYLHEYYSQGQLTNKSKTETTYRKAHAIEQENEYRYNIEQDIWEPTYKFQYTYQGDLLQQTDSYHYSDGAWTLYNTIAFEYDAEDRVASRSSYGNDHTLYTKTTYTYYEDRYEEIFQTNEAGTLVNYSKDINVERPDENYRMHETYRWADQEWRLTYHYTDSPRLYEVVQYEMMDSVATPNFWEQADLAVQDIHYAPWGEELEPFTCDVNDRGDIHLYFPTGNYNEGNTVVRFRTSLASVLNASEYHRMNFILSANRSLGFIVRICSASDSNNTLLAGNYWYNQDQGENIYEINGYGINLDSPEDSLVCEFDFYYVNDDTEVNVCGFNLYEEGTSQVISDYMLSYLHHYNYNEQGQLTDYTSYSASNSMTYRYLNSSNATYQYNAAGDRTSYHYENSYYNGYVGGPAYGSKRVEDVEYVYDEFTNGENVMGCTTSHPLLWEMSNIQTYDLTPSGEYAYLYSNTIYGHYYYDAIPYTVGDLNYELMLNTDAAYVLGAKEPKASIIIPSQINVQGHDLTVIGIDSHAFEDDKVLRHVDIPATISYIGYDAFDDCEIESIIMRATRVPYAEEVFSGPTERHAILYVPADSWHDYAYSEGFSHFINIKKDAATVAAVSDSKVYNMLDSRTMTYVIYDPVNGRLKTLNSGNDINEGNPNHAWMVVCNDRGNFLYNLGARKYAKVSENGALILVDDVTANAVEQGTEGLVIGHDAQRQWNFIEDAALDIDPEVLGNMSAIETITADHADIRTIYNYAGQRTEAQQSGMHIIRKADGTVRKVSVK